MPLATKPPLFIPPEGAMQFELTRSLDGPVSIPFWVGQPIRIGTRAKGCKCKMGWPVLNAPMMRGSNQKRASREGLVIHVCACIGRIIE